MKNMFTLLLVCCGISLFSAAVDLNGNFSGKGSRGLPAGWSFNPYQGHRPVPQVENVNGTLHFTKIAGRHGFGVYSKLFPVSAGGTVSVAAKVRGQGKISVNLHHWSSDNKWLALGPAQTQKLENNWKQIIVRFPVTNRRPGRITGKMRVMFGAGHGETLSIRDLKVDFTPGTYIAGKGTFPAKWKVFLPLDRNFKPDSKTLLSIPEKLNGIAPKILETKDNTILFAPLFGKQRITRSAWLFNEINSPGLREFTIGAGADHWMTVYVNGKAVIDTSKKGNGDGKVGIDNHLGTVWLKKGKNIVAVKFTPGTGSARFCITGPDGLRSLDDYRIIEYTLKDDFEKNISRPGSPEIVTGLISHGLLSETRQGKYKSGSTLIAPRKTALPANLSDARFAMGFRLYALDGKLILKYGKSALVFSHSKNRITALLSGGRKKIFSLPLSTDQLPADCLFTADKNGLCSLVIKSLADSSRHSRTGKLPPAAEAKLFLDKGSLATVDELCSGIAIPSGKKKTFPLKVVPAKHFDPGKAGWKLTFEENFDGKKLDQTRWQVSNPENVQLSGDGKLLIKAAKNKQNVLRSGSVTSRKFFGYGWYEARLKFTRQQGWWSSFWLWGTGHNPMLDGIEIDVFEDYYTRRAQKGEPLTLDHNLHTMAGTTGKSWNYISKIPAAEFEKFHTIACKRTPFEISYYLNGKLIASSSNHSPYNGVVFDPVNHGGGPAELHAIFSGIPMRDWGRKWSDPDKGRFPEYFVVDHFRFYEYPLNKAPQIRWKKQHKNALLMMRPGKRFVFEAQAAPSAATKSPVKNLFLMDNGAIISSVSGSSARFEIAVSPLYYNNTPYLNPGRSGTVPSLDGLHSFSVFAQDAAQMGNWTKPYSVLIVPDKPTRPYKGKAAVIPGKLNPGFYDEGGNGTAYSDDKGNFFNKPGQKPFRPGEDVDSTGTTVGRVVAGEWIKYTVNIAEAGTYKAVLTCGTPIKDREHFLYLFVDGEKEPAGIFKVPPHKESHWGCGSRVTIELELPAGKQRLVLVPFGLFNFSTIEFTKK